MGCHFLLQGIFPTQGANLCLLRLLHRQADSLPLSHWGSPLSENSALQMGCVCVCMPAKSLPSCLSVCDLMDYGPPGSSVHGILQARTLEWVAMPSSRGSSPPRDRTHISYVSRTGRQVLYHERHLGSPPAYFTLYQKGLCGEALLVLSCLHSVVPF